MTVNEEILEKAISNIEGMISLNITDISKGGVYVRSEAQLCLGLFQLIDRLETMKKPAKKVAKK